MKRMRQTAFDLGTAKDMVDSFAYTSGVHCRLYDKTGELIWEQGELSDSCAFCALVTQYTGRSFDCGRIHQHGASEAERFGGRYIYFCPSGMAYFSSPIISGGAVSGAFVGGPVLIMDEDEVIGDSVSDAELTAHQMQRLQTALRVVPKMLPARLSYLSRQLFASAVYVSDSTHELFLSRQGNERQNSISNYIQQYKSDELAKLYPTEVEHNLLEAVENGNMDGGEGYLSELLGYFFASSADRDSLRSRMVELLSLMGRSALYRGASSEQVFAICHKGISRMQNMAGNEEMTQIMMSCRSQLTEIVFHLSDTKHKNIIHRSINYMERNYSQKITLAKVAEYAGYSSTYFSRLFHEEVGCTFQTFLNNLRIEKSKSLLLSTTMSGAEISGLVGFEDQSYFTKTFKRVTGITPDQYRKRKRRIDETRERDG